MAVPRAGLSSVEERRTSLTLAFTLIGVAIVHRHGWFSGAFAWLKRMSASAPPPAQPVSGAPGTGASPTSVGGQQPGANDTGQATSTSAPSTVTGSQP